MTFDWAWISENVRPWIATAGSLASGGIATRLYIAWRNGNISEKQIDVDADDKLSSHYATELAALRAQIVASGEAHARRQTLADERYDAGMKAADAREAHCQEQVATLRAEVLSLSDQVVGLRRLLGQTSASAVILATHAPSADVQDAAHRAAEHITELEDKAHGGD
jgi:hypothetical protein